MNVKIVYRKVEFGDWSCL